jgi:hypothetical protein
MKRAALLVGVVAAVAVVLFWTTQCLGTPPNDDQRVLGHAALI